MLVFESAASGSCTKVPFSSTAAGCSSRLQLSSAASEQRGLGQHISDHAAPIAEKHIDDQDGAGHDQQEDFRGEGRKFG